MAQWTVSNGMILAWTLVLFRHGMLFAHGQVFIHSNVDDTCVCACQPVTGNETVRTYLSSVVSNDTTVSTLPSPPTPKFDVVVVTDDANYWIGQPEDRMLLERLHALGRNVARVSIQDRAFDWNSASMVLIRSAWGKYNYMDHYINFLDSMDEKAILMNPRDLLRWHSVKSTYLPQLYEAGIHMPDMYIFNPWLDYYDDFPGIASVAHDRLGCNQVVVKPAMGNAGAGVKLLRTPDDFEEMEEIFEEFAEEGMEYVNADAVDELDDEDYIIQCFQHRIRTKGERGVVFVGGEVTHGVLKMPSSSEYDEEGNGGFLVHEEHGGSSRIYQPSLEEKEFALQVVEAILKLVGVTPAYLRVDMFYDNDNRLALMELACGTALLWMRLVPKAADALAHYLDNYLKEHADQKRVGDDGTCSQQRATDDTTTSPANSMFPLAPRKLHPTPRCWQCHDTDD